MVHVIVITDDFRNASLIPMVILQKFETYFDKMIETMKDQKVCASGQCLIENSQLEFIYKNVPPKKVKEMEKILKQNQNLIQTSIRKTNKVPRKKNVQRFKSKKPGCGCGG